MQKITFKVQSFRKLPNPYKDAPEGAPQMYYAMCYVTELPDEFPMATNLREQNLNTEVAKRVQASLREEAEQDFFLLNRGILLSVKNATYTNANGELSLVFEDDEVHGNVDGGHTYKIIQKLRGEATPGAQFVKLEILTGVEAVFTKLAAARNYSVGVPVTSHAELEKRFELIKAVLEDSVNRRISYKQNEKGEIDISEILAILHLFNLLEYPNNQTEHHPISSFSGRTICAKRYINIHKEHGTSIENPYVRMTTIMRDILKLYNKLETQISTYYSEGNQGGRYGGVKGVSGKGGEGKYASKIYGERMDYSTPTGFIYPILGAFRSLVVVGEDGYYDWAIDPFATMDKLGKELVCTTVDRSRTLGNNPQSVGKDSGHWKTLYITVKMYLMERQN